LRGASLRSCQPITWRFPVADVIFVAVTIAAFAIIGLVLRAVERL
jgi:hypothetical protein